MQLISGMNLGGYWIANMIADITKSYIPIGLIILICWAFNANYTGVWVLYLIFPWAIVGFTYLTTFAFKSDTVAQIVTLFVHFFVASIGAVLVFVL